MNPILQDEAKEIIANPLTQREEALVEYMALAIGDVQHELTEAQESYEDLDSDLDAETFARKGAEEDLKIAKSLLTRINKALTDYLED